MSVNSVTTSVLVDRKRLGEIARGVTPTKAEEEVVGKDPELQAKLQELTSNHQLALSMFLRGN